MIPVPAEAAKSIKSAAEESKLNTKGFSADMQRASFSF